MSADGFTATEVQEALIEAERELFAWATGKRSTINDMFATENYVNGEADRQKSLALVAQADGAEVEGATNRLVALRLLLGLTKEGNDPREIALWLEARK